MYIISIKKNDYYYHLNKTNNNNNNNNNNKMSVMDKYTDMHTNFVKEILRQLCHPITGVTKNLSPAPVTIDDWNKCLSSLYGWINVGIDEKTANIFHELKIGEVIPSNPADMNIYTYGFATSELSRLLGLKRKKKEFRAILNYYSFLKLINILLNCQETEYQIKFNNSLKLIFKDINPRTFWLNILVTEQTAGYLQSNDIGEVIVKEGTDDNTHIIKSQNVEENKRFPTVWEYEKNNISDDKKTDIINCDNIDEVCEDIDEDVVEDDEVCEDIDEDVVEDGDVDEDLVKDDEVGNYITNQCDDIEISETPYRLVMNNTTFLKLINSTCCLSNSMYKNVNFFQLMGGESEDFSGLFGKLQI